jgi:hypothetical protein
MTAPVYEMMTFYQLDNLAIRVWSKFEAFKMGPDARVVRVLDDVPRWTGNQNMIQHVNILASRVATEMAQLDYVSAYEILYQGQGAVVYNEWP